MIDEPALLTTLHKVLSRVVQGGATSKEGDDFATGIGLGIANTSAPPTGLWPKEKAATGRMIPARLREFTAGRNAARSAMAAIGVPKQPVPVASDRSPAWPAGLIGSISHCEGICIAAVARQGKVAAIGIDVERDVALPDDLFETIFLPEERDWLARCPEPGQARMATLMFSMKESAFKAQYFLSGQTFGFEALTIAPDPAARTFAATFRAAAAPFSAGDQLHGSFETEQNLVLTTVVIPG